MVSGKLEGETKLGKDQNAVWAKERKQILRLLYLHILPWSPVLLCHLPTAHPLFHCLTRGSPFRHRPQLLCHPVTGTQDYRNPSLLQPAKFRDQSPPLSLHLACYEIGGQSRQYPNHSVFLPYPDPATSSCMVREKEGVRQWGGSSCRLPAHREPPKAEWLALHYPEKRGRQILTVAPRAPLSLFLGTGSPWWLFFIIASSTHYLCHLGSLNAHTCPFLD